MKDVNEMLLHCHRFDCLYTFDFSFERVVQTCKG